MKETLSALIDGEISPTELDKLLLMLKKQPALKATYFSWQAASISLQEAPILSTGFQTRFAARLADEPMLNMPLELGSAQRRPFFGWAIAVSTLFISATLWYSLIGQSSINLSMDKHFAQDGLQDYLAAHRAMVTGPVRQKDLQYASSQARRGRV